MKYLLASIACVLAACGGNYSNQDLEFLNALPRQQDLESKLPKPTGTQRAFEGLQQSSVNLGDPSQLYLYTKAASDIFNGGLYALLNLIDAIRSQPPTSRATDKRIWGPFPAQDQPTFWIEVVIERQPTLFTYRIEFQRVGSGTAWQPLVQGTFQVSGGARKGRGDVHLLASAARAAGFLTPGLNDLDTLDAIYVTDQIPIQVDVSFVGSPTAPYVRDDYSYREQANGSGSITFTLKGPFLPGTATETLRIVSRWLRQGPGRADALIIEGIGQGAQAVECWDAQFRVVFAMNNWEPASIGSSASCPDVSGL